MNASASTSCCCRAASTKSSSNRMSIPARRRVNLTGWLLPSALLVLMPKCPACMAAYIAMATGLGISLPTAANVRLMLITLCITSLSWLTIRTLHRLCLNRTRPRS
ncbi:hypothetical protein DES53_101116 [Roseimicrobium gellanilyticum]|uniref:Uncharacterized protein n=1 Tax=Roseimicrobium gellanilyticum TaxID=748857 RepID=A0A366HUG3_9BACT|nr:hypothetical protein [Roseimicrobium gellanilyticum]RBP47319.1 hypothetical protein DES53_101116 [Roseimicrobium gellanilyticum]